MKKIFCLVFALATIGSSSVFADWIIPIEQVPQSVINAVKGSFPTAQILMVEMDDGLYNVKLSNGLEVDVTPNGMIVDIDD